MQIIHFITMFFLSKGIYSYKFPYKCCFRFISFLICCTLIIIEFKVFFKFPLRFIFTHGLFKFMVFNFQIWGDGLFIFLILFSNLMFLYSDNIFCLIWSLRNVFRGGVEGWGEKAHNCNWITIKIKIKKKRKEELIK